MTDARSKEALGAGFFVFRRKAETGRIHPGPRPFEHPTVISAVAEADRLAARHPGTSFVVLAQVYDVELPVPDMGAAQ